MNQSSYKYPFISIIIPLYNVEKYVVRCLDSVISQNYNGKIECILIDDCSQDNTMAVVNGYLHNNEESTVCFSIISHNHNLGVSASRNEATKSAKGDYIFYLDADDYIFPNTISLFTSEASKHPGVDMVMGMYKSDYGDTTYKQIELYKKHQYETQKEWIQFQFINHYSEFPVSCWNKLVRRDFIIENNIQFIPATIHEDNHWLFQVLTHINSFSFVFEPTYYYFKNTLSATNVIKKEEDKHSWHLIMYSYSKLIKKPLRKLKLGRIMLIYFNEHLYEYNYINDRKTRRHFFISCIKCGCLKTAVMLFIMNNFKSLSLKLEIPEKIRQKSYWLFINESMNTNLCGRN